MVKQAKILPLSTVFERDVDLILAEEFQCSESFIRWFWSRVYGEQTVVAIGSLDDVRVRQRDESGGEGSGETDITVDIPIIAEERVIRCRFLIENKIAAEFQPNQPERYLARLREAEEAKECDQGRCVLVAPADYMRAVAGCQAFHARVTYEEVQAYFEQSMEPDAPGETLRRRRFKRDVFRQAVTKRQGGWPVRNPDQQVTRFFRQVYEIAQEVAPQLRMAEPKGKNNPTTWIYLASALKKAVSFKANIHIKPDKGYADIQISKWARHLTRVKEVLGPLAEKEGLRIEEATESAAVRVAIPTWSGDQPFANQRNAIAEGFKNTLRLQAWYEKNLPTLEELGREFATQLR